MALRRFAQRLLLRETRPIFPYGLGNRLLLADLRAFSRSGEERRGYPPRTPERIRLYCCLGLVLLGMRRHARVQAVLARVGQRVGLGQDAARAPCRSGWTSTCRTPACPTTGSSSLESASNSCPSNVDYRAWWFQEVARHCQTSMIYQDNPPYGYFYQPAVGYGYTRDDGVQEPTCATWNARQFMRRALHVAVESGAGNPAPGVYPNVCGSAQPGRSFCFRGLTGEYLESDRIPLGTLRVWCSRQWGMNIDWLMQEPNAGATLKYWRALCSRLFLLDVTSFSRWDSADQASCWLQGLGPLLAGRSHAGLASLLSQSDREIDAPPDDARLRLHGQGPRAAGRLEPRRGRRRGKRAARRPGEVSAPAA